MVRPVIGCRAARSVDPADVRGYLSEDAAERSSAQASAAQGCQAFAGPDGETRAMPEPIRAGADVAAASGWKPFHDTRLGVFSNPTGILRDTRHVVDDIATYDDIELVAVFGPEHGFRGSAQAGYSEGDTVDPRTGIATHDAYGAEVDRLVELFESTRLETVAFDMQDVGVRYYTYIWSMYRAMVAAARLGVRFVVLDRPNPLGDAVDGPRLEPAYATGVGLREIVQRPGMTIGELARFFNGEFVPGVAGRPVELEVVETRGWRPGSPAWPAELRWVPPSPNIPTVDSALTYVGTGWFEGTNVSCGRGTTRPFELLGAPFLDHRWSDRLNARGLPGVRFREAYFVPTFDRHVGEVCAGVQLHITDYASYQPIRTAVAMLAELRSYDEFEWRMDDYDAERPYWVDKLAGSPRLRTMLDAGADVDEVVGAWHDEVREFDERRRPYLLYGSTEGDRS